MGEPEIKILRIVRTTGIRRIRAYVDVQIGDWKVFDWRIIQRGPGEPLQVVYPQVSYRDKQGAFKYRSLLSLPSQLKQSIDLQILLAWKLEDQSGTDRYITPIDQ